MPRVETHHVSGSTERHVIIDDETHAFAVPDEEADADAYEYLGDGDAPDGARSALEDWVAEYHDVQENETPDQEPAQTEV